MSGYSNTFPLNKKKTYTQGFSSPLRYNVLTLLLAKVYTHKELWLTIESLQLLL
ncbi:hypothetical protein SPAP_1153 [Streptococcus pneumoniae AP200]|nr:hypothetical protein SPAP_1153 [Streptococcus pneumoniae AP200]EHD89873.1 hypothetical protein SPAR31_1059 [Streptococcus pneumoniae GA13494]